MIEKTKKFVSIRQLSEIHPAFTGASLRWIIFNKKSNGASVFLRRIGKKIVIDLEAFETWVSQKEEKR
jgi:hypothetical protein